MFLLAIANFPIRGSCEDSRRKNRLPPHPGPPLKSVVQCLFPSHSEFNVFDRDVSTTWRGPFPDEALIG